MTRVVRNIAAIAALGVLAAGSGCGVPDAGPVPEPEVVRVALSESTLPMLRRVAELAEGSLPAVEVEFLPPMHSSGAVAATHLGEAQFGVVSRALTPDEKDFGLKYIHVARDPLVFATHRGVGLDGLSSSDVRKIYAGDVINWRDLGGPDLPIVVLDRGEHTSPKRALRQELLRDVEITPAALVLERPGMMTDSLNSIAGAIGFTTLGQILTADVEVAVLTIDGEAPSTSNAVTGRDPWAVPVVIVLPPTPDRASLRRVELQIGVRVRPSFVEFGDGALDVRLVKGSFP